ncbi:DHA2 family efflux MFS transporter permease subunit [Agromyces protaetiae]|uniref:DHA2 family efflux MFS transporter permease subunit n=1 Tax=Agromyces protaetiae TaxID=2509455 RepID=A0A4P6FBR3_9MICO|nr:DHA2 family efflux MFS transporter permease subunit [Agromyces protaetiae]QAY73066.1 DHA2 family efflux MFS transporter permease subunit [Agromyces protaetiae]
MSETDATGSHVPVEPTGSTAALSPGRSALVLAICCSSLFLVSLDATIVNVALPSIARELHSSVSALQWTVDAYVLVLASLLLLSGSLADRFGRRRVFAAGLAIFTTGSLLCSTASSDVELILFRMLQAVGGSAMTPVALAIVTNVFTAPAARARAIGWWAAVSGIGIAAGPLLGGLLIDTIGWRSIFWINVPTGIAALVLALIFVPESKAAEPRRFDPVGQVVVIVFLGTLIFTIIEAPNLGWTSPWIIAGAAAALLAGAKLVLYESRRPAALVPVAMFRLPSFATSFAIAVLGFFAFSGLLFANTLYLQEVRGLPASLAGLLTVPLALGTIVAAPASGAILAKVGPRRPLLIAGSAMAVGAGFLPFFDMAGMPVGWLALPFALFGAGFGMLNAPVNDTAVSDLPDDRAGVAASLISTAKQVGSALGVAVVGSLIAVTMGGTLAQAFDMRSWIAWTVVAGCGLGITALAAIWAKPAGQPVRARMAA